MHVDVDPETGALTIRPPSSRPGTFVELRAECDLVVGLSACAAGTCNGGRQGPIAATVLAGHDPA